MSTIRCSYKDSASVSAAVAALESAYIDANVLEIRINAAYADWYRSRHGKEVDRSLVLLVLKALQGHPEAGG
jgi:hypothetical protein